MALSNFVKINKVSSLSDARYCAGMGVDVLGFSLVPEDPSYVSPQQFKEITQWVSGPRFAGECGSMDTDLIKLASTAYTLDYLETTQPDQLEVLSTLSIPIILKQPLSSPKELDQLKGIISFAEGLFQYLHLELKTDDSLFQLIQKEINDQLIIHFYKPLDAINLINQSSIGISLTAQIEQETGLQDYGEIMDVLEALEIEE